MNRAELLTLIGSVLGALETQYDSKAAMAKAQHDLARFCIRSSGMPPDVEDAASEALLNVALCFVGAGRPDDISLIRRMAVLKCQILRQWVTIVEPVVRVSAKAPMDLEID